MKTALAATTTLFATALATPAFLSSSQLRPRASNLCVGGVGSTPQCCAVDVLGVADLDCSARASPFSFPVLPFLCSGIRYYEYISRERERAAMANMCC